MKYDINNWPEEYWVENTQTTKSSYTVDDLSEAPEFVILACKLDNSHKYGQYSYYKFRKDKCVVGAHSLLDTSPIVPYEDWKAYVLAKTNHNATVTPITEQPKFKVGDKVICIDITTNFDDINGSSRWRSHLQLNKEYKITFVNNIGDVRVGVHPDYNITSKAFKLAEEQLWSVGDTVYHKNYPNSFCSIIREITPNLFECEWSDGSKIEKLKSDIDKVIKEGTWIIKNKSNNNFINNNLNQTNKQNGNKITSTDSVRITAGTRPKGNCIISKQKPSTITSRQIVYSRITGYC